MTLKNSLRNVGILAHVDAGKTTLTENMLFLSGKIRLAGSVDRGTAYTDYMDVERERGISVRSASTSFIWKGVQISIIDTPGHVDFSAEVERSLQVLDCAVLVISAVEGVQAQAEILWKALRSMNIPTIIFLNKIDRIGARTAKIIDEIHQLFSNCVLPLQYISGEGTQNPGITSIWSQKEPSGSIVQSALGNIIECLADMDEGILEKYISGEHISWDQLEKRIAFFAHDSKVFPLFFGSAIKGIGVAELMDGIMRYLPEPKGNSELPLSAVVFRIDRDPSMGRTAHVRLYNGTIKARDIVFNETRKLEEKVTHVRRIDIKKYEDAGILYAGEIGAVSGLSQVHIGDILGCTNAVQERFHLSVPFLSVQAYPAGKTEYTELVAALLELGDEDPMLDAEWRQSEKEIHLKIMGTIQMEILTSVLKSRFGLDVSFGKTSVIYKETPSSSGEGFVSYTMPKPCWAVLRFLVEPGERGTGISYSSKVRTEYIPERYQKQVEKSLPGALEQGLYGWEVTDINVTLIDGEYHVQHTHSPDFAIATPMGIMDGLANSGTNLLEPIMKFRITTPENEGGKVLNDLVQMRGLFDSPIISKGTLTVDGFVPAAASLDYHIRLASITGGRGTIITAFSGYSQCPPGFTALCPRRGVDPFDRSKYILYARNAFASGSI